MNCFYCPFEIKEPKESAPGVVHDLLCPMCASVYSMSNFHKGPTIVSWKKLEIDNRVYRVKVYPLEEIDIKLMTKPGPRFILFYLNQNKPFATWDAPLMLDFIPDNWTPHNNEQKLKTYLPFL